MADMGMKVIGLKEKQRELVKFRNLIKRGKKEIWKELGDEAIDIIKSRTAKGKDIKGKKFKAYTPIYAKKKGSSIVNLKKSGKMLKAINKQTWSRKCRIFVKSTARKQKIDNYNLTIVHNFGTRKMPKREYMGLIRKEVKKLKELCKRLYYKEVDKIFK